MFVGNLIFADDACDMNTLGPSLVDGMEDKLVMPGCETELMEPKTSGVFMARSSRSSGDVEV